MDKNTFNIYYKVSVVDVVRIKENMTTLAEYLKNS